MQKYKCHKTVEAAKIASFGVPNPDEDHKLVFEDDSYALVNAEWLAKHQPQVGGYFVVYEDGYQSYSPPEPFESGYSPVSDVTEATTGLDFGQALSFLRRGCRIARAGWNGKGMFLWLLPAGEVPKTAIFDPSLRAVIDQHTEGDTFTALPSIRMWTRNAEGRWGVLTGWLASQTDMLSDDWEVVG